MLTGRLYTAKHSSKIYQIPNSPRALSEIYKRALKPGGWLEHHEGTPDPQSDDGTVTPASPFGRWGSLIAQAGQILGKDFGVGYHTKEFMEEAGFINVVEKKFKLPIGKWPADPRMKELGIWYRAYFEDGMEGYAMALLTRVLGVRSRRISILISYGWLANYSGDG